MVPMKDLVTYMAEALVDYPEKVQVNVVEGENSVIMELKVAPEDVGKVIGKWFAHNTRGWINLESVRFHKGVGLLKFSGIDSISDAEKLREAEVFISENDRPTLNEDEYYYDQLVGLKVLDAESGEEIGIVSAIVYGKGSESLELDLSGTRVLLPIVEQFIQEINIDEGVISVRIPPGLIETYR